MFKNDPNNLKKMQITILTDLDENLMMDLLASTNTYVHHVTENAHDEADKIRIDTSLTIDEKDQLLEFLSDDINSAKEAMDLAQELAIIGLYKTIELRINKSVRASGLMSNNKISQLSAIGTLIYNFNNIGIDVTKIDHFNEFRELKLINNALKHTGEINQELEDLNPTVWTKGQPLNNFTAHFIRLLSPNINFLNNLGTKLRSKL